MNVDDKTYQRFMSKVSKDPCGCWHWTASKDKNGYGQIKIKTKTLSSHRISYIIHNGEIKDGLCVCHSCDNPSCVNPDHLWLGTVKENINDSVNKKRHVGFSFKGEKHPIAKLTDENAKEIKNSSLKLKELAKKFNVTESTISLIKNNKKWRHI